MKKNHNCAYKVECHNTASKLEAYKSGYNIPSENKSDSENKKKLSLFLSSQVIVVFLILTYFQWNRSVSYEQLVITDQILRKDFIILHHKGPKLELSDFLLHLNSSSGKKIARLDVEFYLNQDSAKKEVKNTENQIRKFSLMMLSKTDFSDFSNERKVNLIQDKIKTRLNQFLTKGEIVQVYLKNFKRI